MKKLILLLVLLLTMGVYACDESSGDDGYNGSGNSSSSSNTSDETSDITINGTNVKCVRKNKGTPQCTCTGNGNICSLSKFLVNCSNDQVVNIQECPSSCRLTMCE